MLVAVEVAHESIENVAPFSVSTMHVSFLSNFLFFFFRVIKTTDAVFVESTMYI